MIHKKYIDNTWRFVRFFAGFFVPLHVFYLRQLFLQKNKTS